MKHYVRVLKRLARQSFIPALLSLLYALWDSFENANRTAPDFIKALVGSFFFIMWFSGQWLRADKQITDSDDLSSIKESLTEMKTAFQNLDDLNRSFSVSDIRDPTSRTLLGEAEAAMNGGLTRPALVTAAVAFEHAIRHCAAKFELPHAFDGQVQKLLIDLSGKINSAIVEDLRGLWRARNSLMHSKSDEFKDKDLAGRLFNSFKWAVDFLISQDDGQAMLDKNPTSELDLLRNEVSDLRLKLKIIHSEYENKINKIESERKGWQDAAIDEMSMAATFRDYEKERAWRR